VDGQQAELTYILLVFQLPTFFAFALALRQRGSQFAGLGIRSADLGGPTGTSKLYHHASKYLFTYFILHSMVHAWWIYFRRWSPRLSDRRRGTTHSDSKRTYISRSSSRATARSWSPTLSSSTRHISVCVMNNNNSRW
jgi:hypothetical protein